MMDNVNATGHDNHAQVGEVTDQKPDLVIITGMSGAGRTEAMHTFEDLGYFCIDNLPPRLLMNLVSLANIPGQSTNARKLAVVIDARNRVFFHELVGELDNLRNADISYRIIFMDSDDSKLISRYKASRRRHPMCVDSSMTMAQGIQAERELLSELRNRADIIIDTTSVSPMQLRLRIRDLYSASSAREGMEVVVYSFGFKHGSPTDADIVIDVRFLPNPFYEPALRQLTGLDQEVRDYVMKRPETKEFMQAWEYLLRCVMPGYVEEGKQQLTIGVGCTGGQHRSVALAAATSEFLKREGYFVNLQHRDIALADTVVAK